MIWIRKLRRLSEMRRTERGLHAQAKTAWYMVWKPAPERKTINRMWGLFTEDLHMDRE